MNNRRIVLWAFITLFLLLTSASCSTQMENTKLPESTNVPNSTVQEPKPTEDTPEDCLPRYGNRKTILQINETNKYYETFPTLGDFNGDGLVDIVVTRLQFQTDTAFELDILLNTGDGGMELATSDVFSEDVPVVQHPTEVIVADFNGDKIVDIFVGSSGRDSDPFPGFQNALALSDGKGKLINATENLPQQKDLTHSACAADIDNDGDIDLYTGNYWGQNNISPQILLNDGKGEFTVGDGHLPTAVNLEHAGFTICAFADVNNDKNQDLILGNYEAIRGNESISRVLLNDGFGKFTQLTGALPPKKFDPSDKAQDIKPIDLNGDGFLDLIIVYERLADTSNYVLALVNNQDGTFTDESETRLASFYQNYWPGYRATSGTPRRVLELRDMDRDGDLDLIMKPLNNTHPEPLVMLNDGNGNFLALEMDFSMRDGDLYFNFIDLENDGGQDLVFILNFPPDYVETVSDLGCDRNITLPFSDDFENLIPTPTLDDENPTAINDPNRNTDEIAGDWKGIIKGINSDFSTDIEISIQAGCLLGKICGEFAAPTFQCFGDLILTRIDGNTFIFQEQATSGDCEGGGYDLLSISPDDTIEYSYSTNGFSESIISVAKLRRE